MSTIPRILRQQARTTGRAASTLTRNTTSSVTRSTNLQKHEVALSLSSVKNTVRSNWSSVRHASTTDKSGSEDTPFVNPETLILEGALNHVSTHGWSKEALAEGAKAAGYPSIAHGMLPRGEIELVDYFMDKCKDKLRDTLTINAPALQDMTVADRLKFGVRTRLEMIEPVLSTWPQAMALGAMPQNASTTMHKLALLVDEIWYYAGDKSMDMSWYTKRAVLTAIYASTELHMLSDSSPAFEETWKFLDRRVEETIQLGETPQNMQDVASMVGLGIQSMVSGVTSLAGPVGQQVVNNSPLANMPNPIAAMSDSVPTSVNMPSNPFAEQTSSPPPPPFESGAKLESKDLKEIDEELEKLGGADATRK